MPTSIEQVSYTVRKQLVAGWNPANTMSLTPRIQRAHPGRSTSFVIPLVSVGLDEEDPLLETITPTGPGAIWDGTVTAMTWVDPETTLQSGGGEIGHSLSSKLSDLMASEIRRIIRANQTTTADLLTLRPISRRYSPDDSESPVLDRHIVTIGYAWAEQPA